MRKLLLSSAVLVVFALGLGGAFLVFSPGAGAHDLVDGTFTGHVGSSGNPDAFVIALNNPATVAPGTYEFDITDYASIHNFDLCKASICTAGNSIDKTDIGGTGTVQWTVALTPGTYTYQCDAHYTQLSESFTVSGGTTSTTTTTTPAVTAQITKVVKTRKLVTVTAKANQTAQFKAWLLQNGKQFATTSTTGTTVQLKLKPVKALKPGYYTVQVRAFTSSTNFKVVKKKIYVG